MGFGSFVKNIKEKLGLNTGSQASARSLPSLEYVLIFQESGIPIYTRCMGQVCKMLAVDETLLSGFLSAISTLPSMFGQDNKTERMAIELGKFKLLFHPTTKHHHVVCIGIPLEQHDDETEVHIRKALTEIERILESRFEDENWNFLTSEKITRLEHVLAEEVFVKYFEVSEPPHDHDEMCPIGPKKLIETQDEFRGQQFWTRVSNLYKAMKAGKK